MARGSARAVGHAWQTSYERLWERLIEFLNEVVSATEIEAGRTEVVLAGPTGTRVIEIVMTRNEWDDMVTIPCR